MGKLSFENVDIAILQNLIDN